jgi:acetyl-CoA carboxylase/biotin carboxylase 1
VAVVELFHCNCLLVIICLQKSEPIHILSVGIKDNGDTEDSTMSLMFGGFCNSNREELANRGIRRITFAVLVR